MLILSETQITSLKLDAVNLVNALDAAFQRGECDSVSGLKVQVPSIDGGFFQALPAVLTSQNRAAVKWVGVNSGRTGGPRIQASIILSDARTGEPLALLAAAGLTAIRTAAMSALAARYLMRSDVGTIGFLGCGAQAHAHLKVFTSLYPQLKFVRCFSPSSGEKFAASLRENGVDAVATQNARDVVVESDVVISSVPDLGEGQGPTFNASWIKPHSFVSMVDLGRAWIPGTQTANTRLFTDYIPQTSRLVEMGKLKFATEFVSDLYGLANAGKCDSAKDPTIFAFGGLGMCDAVVADRVFECALVTGIGSEVDMM